ncbi:methyltransferase family protein [Kitasatospora sp. NPDC052896]|uniref:methyltransferase family protein n=1 Tax=Kitasatospora sp. NPDC052896 TaxID=3364061 RepID=UPI0037C9C12C
MALWVAAEVWLQVRQFRRSGRTARTEWRTLLAIAVLSGGSLALAGPAARALPGLSFPVAWALPALLVLTWAGIALRLWSIHTLGRFFRGTVHVQEGHQVVDWGPYRRLRHPAYSGALLAATATTLSFGNAASFAVVMGALGLAVGYRIRVEERILAQALGASYTGYAARTHRLVPGVW